MDDRWLGRAGVFAWGMVGLPMVLDPPPSAWRLAVWASAYAVFGAAAWAWSRASTRPAHALLAAESACVVAMVAVLCNGFEGALLVLVAIQLSRRAPPRLAWSWIAVQTLLFGAAITVHWSLPPALMLAPPYLGLQILVHVLVRQLGSIGAAGRLEERLRIARDLHDALGHHLTALSLNLEVAAHTVEGAAAAPVRTAQSIARLLLADVRDVVSALHVEDRIDLPAALRRLAADIPEPRVHLSVTVPLTADPVRSQLVLRCAQEMITNAARHARARNLWLDVAERGPALEIRARDDGDGAAELRDGQGLRGMRARLELVGGTLSVATGPGAGFVVVATVPQGPPV